MTARRSMVLLAILLAGMIVLLLAGLFVVDAARGPGAGNDATPPPPSGKGAPPAAAPAPPPPKPAPPAGGTPASAPGSEDPATRHRLHVRVRWEDGTPCDEGSFLEMVRGDDGTPEVSLDSEMNGGVGATEPGNYILSWAKRPESLVLLLVSRELDAISASGGTVLPSNAHGPVLGVDVDGPLEIVARWRPGSGWIAAKRAESEVRLGARDGLIVRWRRGDGTLEPIDVPGRGRDGDPWFRVHPPAAKEGEDASAATAVLEVLANETAAVRVPLAEMRGRVEVVLGPAVADVTGSVTVPGVGGKRIKAGWTLALSPEPPRPPEGIVGGIDGAGRLSLFHVPDGQWTLSVWAVTPEGIRWGWRSFDKVGPAVDIGNLEISAWSGFRVRALDADGAPIPVQLEVTPVQQQISNGPRLLAFDVREGDAEDEADPVVGAHFVVIQEGMPRVTRLNSADESDSQGWTTIRDLRPGMRYVIRSGDPIPIRAEEEAPSRTGVIKDVEIRTAFRKVRASLRFTVEGVMPAWNAPEDPSADRVKVLFHLLHNDHSLPEEGWRADGTWTGSIYPGRYLVQRSYVPEKATDDKPTRRVSGSVEIPAGETFEATVDLR